MTMIDPDAIAFERESRTPYSEVFTILEDGSIIGRIDLHYQDDHVLGTLCTTADADDERLQSIIDVIDERLVMTGAPFRADFIVSVWKGRPAGVFSDDAEDDDEEPFRFNVGDLSPN